MLYILIYTGKRLKIIPFSVLILSIEYLVGKICRFESPLSLCGCTPLATAGRRGVHGEIFISDDSENSPVCWLLLYLRAFRIVGERAMHTHFASGEPPRDLCRHFTSWWGASLRMVSSWQPVKRLMAAGDGEEWAGVHEVMVPGVAVTRFVVRCDDGGVESTC